MYDRGVGVDVVTHHVPVSSSVVCVWIADM